MVTPAADLPANFRSTARHDARTLETAILHLVAIFNRAELQFCSNVKLQPCGYMIGLGSNMRSRNCAGTST